MTIVLYIDGCLKNGIFDATAVGTKELATDNCYNLFTYFKFTGVLNRYNVQANNIYTTMLLTYVNHLSCKKKQLS